MLPLLGQSGKAGYVVDLKSRREGHRRCEDARIGVNQNITTVTLQNLGAGPDQSSNFVA